MASTTTTTHFLRLFIATAATFILIVLPTSINDVAAAEDSATNSTGPTTPVFVDVPDKFFRMTPCTKLKSKTCLNGANCTLVAGEPTCECSDEFAGYSCHQKKTCDYMKYEPLPQTVELSHGGRKQYVHGNKTYEFYTNDNCILMEKNHVNLKKTFGFVLSQFNIKVCYLGKSNVDYAVFAGSDTGNTLALKVTLPTNASSSSASMICQNTTVSGTKVTFYLERLAKEHDFAIVTDIHAEVGRLKDGAIAAIGFMIVLLMLVVALVVMAHQARNKTF